jgi:stearoyl-CoA desaturase (delta-9 desaturase)
MFGFSLKNYTLWGLPLKEKYCFWLLMMHVLALIGFIQICMQTKEVIHKTILWCTLFHSLYAFGITVGVHRLWAHKTYEASFPLKILLMVLNCGAF